MSDRSTTRRGLDYEVRLPSAKKRSFHRMVMNCIRLDKHSLLVISRYRMRQCKTNASEKLYVECAYIIYKSMLCVRKKTENILKYYFSEFCSSLILPRLFFDTAAFKSSRSPLVICVNSVCCETEQSSIQNERSLHLLRCKLIIKRLWVENSFNVLSASVVFIIATRQFAFFLR